MYFLKALRRSLQIGIIIIRITNIKIIPKKGFKPVMNWWCAQIINRGIIVIKKDDIIIGKTFFTNGI
jgi:hypothetical protein